MSASCLKDQFFDLDLFLGTGSREIGWHLFLLTWAFLLALAFLWTWAFFLTWAFLWTWASLWTWACKVKVGRSAVAVHWIRENLEDQGEALKSPTSLAALLQSVCQLSKGSFF